MGKLIYPPFGSARFRSGTLWARVVLTNMSNEADPKKTAEDLYRSASEHYCLNWKDELVRGLPPSQRYGIAMTIIISGTLGAFIKCNAPPIAYAVFVALVIIVNW